jgi:hypothetical protein
MQPGRNLRPVVIHKDDYQPCGGEKRAGLRPPPCPQLQGCSSSCWGGRRAELGSCLPHGLATASSSSIRGRRAFTSLAEEANFGYAGSAGCRRRQLPRVWFLGLEPATRQQSHLSCLL